MGNVPNALTFIDKYTQVPRILNPIVQVIEAIPRVAEVGHVKDMMEAAHGSVQECQLDILQDFFKHAFDGSGATNWTKNIIIQFSSFVDSQASMEASRISS